MRGHFVSALFASYVGQTYSFDIVVRSLWQGRGLGRELLDTAITAFDNIVEADPYAEMRLNVVSDIMEEALLRRGFVVLDRGFGSTVMTKDD